jgi:hypothetical protein
MHFAVGRTLHLQTWYRNIVGPCGARSNLTSGVAVTFTP